MCYNQRNVNSQLRFQSFGWNRWRYAFYRKSRQADAEGEAWEAAKKKCGGLHFLAVQQSLDSELCTGFWLLIDVPQSPV